MATRSTTNLPQQLLSARSESGRVTIGWDAPELLRRLSDARLLTCPACEAPVVLHAGTVRAHHFAHLPGAFCRFPQTEPETAEHRAGKLLLAQWLHARMPEAEIIIEAFLPATRQRADILMRTSQEAPANLRTVALEFQCANLAAREWQRRHRLYRDAGIEDLWILGGSRRRGVHGEGSASESGADTDIERRRGTFKLLAGELERALLDAGAPLLYLDAAGISLEAGVLARFRPATGAQQLNPAGTLSGRRLLDLPFPWQLLGWPDRNDMLPAAAAEDPTSCTGAMSGNQGSSERLWLWLEQRYRVTPSTLASLFGLPVHGQECILCETRLWQAAIYYRFIHQRVGSGWWLPGVETWARTFLPLSQSTPIARLRTALREVQNVFAAAGLLTLPVGYARSSARVAADLDTLSALPDRAEVVRIAGYRRLLDR